MAEDPNYLPWRRPLWPARGDGVVRENGIDYIFGLPATRALAGEVDEVADDIRTRRALEEPCLRGFTETRYQAKSWDRERRACARIEATTRASTSALSSPASMPGRPSISTTRLYCARGQAENLIKCTRRSSPPTAPLPRRSPTRSASCCTPPLIGRCSPCATPFPKSHAIATAEFATLRLRLLKLGARVSRRASRVRLAFAAACPDADLIRHIAAALMPAGP